MDSSSQPGLHRVAFVIAQLHEVFVVDNGTRLRCFGGELYELGTGKSVFLAADDLVYHDVPNSQQRSRKPHL